LSSLPKAVVDQLLRQIDQKLKHRHDSREGCRSINTDMQIASRVRTLPPLKVQSRAMVRNFNAQFLQGKTVEQIVAEAQGGYSPHARLHDHSLAADGQTINARAINCFGDPVQALIQGFPTNIATYYGLVAYPGGPAWLDIDNYIPGHETWVYLIADIDTDALQIGGESKEGGNISVWRDTSNNKQMFLDADADGATVKTGLEVYADTKIGRVGSGFVLKSPDGTAYRLRVDNNGNLYTETEAGAAGATLAWIKVAEVDVSGAAVTNIDISGLDLDSHKSYQLWFKVHNPLGVGSAYRVFFNADYTLTNYTRQVLWADGTSIGSVRVDGCDLCDAPDGRDAFAIAEIMRTPDGYPRFMSRYQKDNPAYVVLVMDYVAWETAANVTSIRVASEQTDAIGVGSKLILYRTS